MKGNSTPSSCTFSDYRIWKGLRIFLENQNCNGKITTWFTIDIATFDCCLSLTAQSTDDNTSRRTAHANVNSNSAYSRSHF